MNMKTKTLTAVSIAALAVPGAALAEGKGHGKSGKAKTTHAKKGPKAKAFTVKGVDAANLAVTDGKLAGPLTLDPTSANKHARVALTLTKTELRGEDTVTFGEAGDALRIKYVGLQSTDALQPTDKVKVIGKVTRSGDLDIRKITVVRETAENETETQS